MVKMMLTSKNDGHRHKWMRGKMFTTINSGHKHRIKGMMALRADGHTHKLLKITRVRRRSRPIFRNPYG